MLKRIMKAALAASLVFGFSAGLYAEDFFKGYGSARIAVDQVTLSKEKAGNADGDSDLTLGLAGNSRFGASAQKGDITGKFEYGSNANLRLLYASVPMGGGSLTIGQTYGPVNVFISDQVGGGDSDMLNVGGIYGGRNPQIQFTTGGLAVALVATKTAGVTDITAADIDTTLPKIEAAYSTKMGSIDLGAVFGMQSYTIQTNAVGAVGAKDYSVASTVIGLHASMNLGMADVKFNYLMATNGSDYGLWMEGAGGAVYDGTGIKDTTTSGMVLVVAAKMSDSMTVEGGYGTLSHQSAVTDAKADGTSAMYVQVSIKTDSGLLIVPNFNTWDYQKDSADNTEGTKTSIGAKLQLNF